MIQYQVKGELVQFDDINAFYSDVKSLLEKHDEIILDFDKVNFISSSGVGKIITIQNLLLNTQKMIKVVHLKKEPKKILKEMSFFHFTPNISFEE